MKLVIASDNSIEYDLSDELAELELESMFDNLFGSGRTLTDEELRRALADSPWERMQSC